MYISELYMKRRQWIQYCDMPVVTFLGQKVQSIVLDCN